MISQNDEINKSCFAEARIILMEGFISVCEADTEIIHYKNPADNNRQDFRFDCYEPLWRQVTHGYRRRCLTIGHAYIGSNRATDAFAP